MLGRRQPHFRKGQSLCQIVVPKTTANGLNSQGTFSILSEDISGQKARHEQSDSSFGEIGGIACINSGEEGCTEENQERWGAQGGGVRRALHASASGLSHMLFHLPVAQSPHGRVHILPPLPLASGLSFAVGPYLPTTSKTSSLCLLITCFSLFSAALATL